MPSLTGEPTGSWTLLRVVANDGGAGSFSDDTDYAGTNTAPPAGERLAVPGQLTVTGTRTQRVSVFIVAVDANDAVVARAGTCAVDFIEIARTREDEGLYRGTTEFVVDATPLTGVALNRKVELDLEKGQYAVRLHTFSSMPGTASELRVYAKVS